MNLKDLQSAIASTFISFSALSLNKKETKQYKFITLNIYRSSKKSMPHYLREKNKREIKKNIWKKLFTQR